MDVICEEAKHGKESIAESLANSEGIRYRNIEMSLDRRAELGIPPLYSIDLPGSEYSREQKGQWNDQREAYLLYTLLDAVAYARVVVVICGVSHMSVLAQALHSKFNRVEQYDVTAMPWFHQSLL